MVRFKYHANLHGNHSKGQRQTRKQAAFNVQAQQADQDTVELPIYKENPGVRILRYGRQRLQTRLFLAAPASLDAQGISGPILLPGLCDYTGLAGRIAALNLVLEKRVKEKQEEERKKAASHMACGFNDWSWNPVKHASTTEANGQPLPCPLQAANNTNNTNIALIPTPEWATIQQELGLKSRVPFQPAQETNNMAMDFGPTGSSPPESEDETDELDAEAYETPFNSDNAQAPRALASTAEETRNSIVTSPPAYTTRFDVGSKRPHDDEIENHCMGPVAKRARHDASEKGGKERIPPLEPLERPLTPNSLPKAEWNAYRAYRPQGGRPPGSYSRKARAKPTGAREGSRVNDGLNYLDRPDSRRRMRELHNRARRIGKLEAKAGGVVRPPPPPPPPQSDSVLGAGRPSCGNSAVGGERPFPPKLMIQWTADLARLQAQWEEAVKLAGSTHRGGETSSSHVVTPQLPAEHAETLALVLSAIESFESHPEFTFARLGESGLFVVLAAFRKVGHAGPGVGWLVHRVEGILKRGRDRFNKFRAAEAAAQPV